MTAMQKENTDNFTGVEIKVHNAYLYIPTGADTFFTVPKIFNYDRPNIYDRIEIGNYPFFKNLRSTISDMTRHYNQLMCSMEITGFNNGIQKFHFKLIYENDNEFIRICSSIIANVAYFVAAVIDKYDMVQVYGHSIGSEEEGDFILDISNDFTYTFKLDDGDWLNNLLLVAHTDMRGIAYSYEVNNEFDEGQFYVAFKGFTFLMPRGILIVTNDYYTIALDLHAEYFQYQDPFFRYPQMPGKTLKGVKPEQLAVLFYRLCEYSF